MSMPPPHMMTLQQHQQQQQQLQQQQQQHQLQQQQQHVGPPPGLAPAAPVPTHVNPAFFPLAVSQALPTGPAVLITLITHL